MCDSPGGGGPGSDGSPGSIEFVHRSWPADPAQLSVIRHQLASWLGPLDLTEEETADVVLAVDEAAANVVRHAYGADGGEDAGESGGAVELTLWTETEPAGGRGGARTTLSIEVVDHGHWRPPADAPTDGGRGIRLMSSMSESVLIHHDARGSRVLLRHRIPGPA